MPTDPDQRLLRFASEHYGLYRSADALRAGLSPGQITRRVVQGRALRRGRGIYVVAGAPSSDLQDLLVAVWRTGGVGSHRSAAKLQVLSEQGPAWPEVTVPVGAAHEFDGVIVHRSRDLRRSRTVLVGGIPVTNPTRTLVDIGQVISETDLETMVHVALHRRLTHVDRLIAEYFAISRHGRRGAGPIGRLLRELDPSMGPAESKLELVLLGILDENGLPAPVRQHPVAVSGENFRLDVAYPEEKLFIEGDGFGAHGTRTAFENDRWRQNLLVLAGWSPLRFTWRQLRQHPEAVASQVARALRIRGADSA